MTVAVAVDDARLAGWQRTCIDALRASGADVRVVRTAVPARRAAGMLRKLGGPALAAATVLLDGTSPDGADLIVDLTAAHAVTSDAPNGVWSFRLGESDDAGLPFAREIGRGAHTIEVALERRRGGVRDVVRSGRFGVMPSYRATLRLALGEAARWPAIMLGAPAAAPQRAGEPSVPFVRRPLDGARFAGSLATRTARMLVDQFFEVVEWNVGFIDGGPRALLQGAPLAVRWLAQPAPLTFVADPFVVERDGRRVLFVEDFDYGRDRGVIDALELDADDRVVRRSRALDLATHLSYPHPLELDGELYLIPENCAASEVALYRCVRFPDRWERECAIMPDFDGVDTTVFERDGLWWALCTRTTRGANQALYASFAPSPRGPWRPHARNPIVTDIASARPAGRPFVVDGVLYRPGQDCSRSYGCGLTIARVDALSPADYRETVVRRIEPSAFTRYSAGIHTVNFCNATGVVDGKHVRYDVRKLVWAARKLRDRTVRTLAGRRKWSKSLKPGADVPIT